MPLERREELEQFGVELVGGFLLDPVTDAVEDHRLVQVGHGLAELGDGAGAPDGRPVDFAAHEQAGLDDGCAVERGHVLPVAVHVAVAVQPAGHAGAGEFPDVVAEVGLRHPLGPGACFGPDEVVRQLAAG